MSFDAQSRIQLLSYMKEAFHVCTVLKEYTEKSQDIFLGDNDQAIIGAIQAREPIVEQLMALESKIDLILDEADECAGSRVLPQDAETLRGRIRELSRSVLNMDLEAMKHISLKMQEYKDETLKARNKKSLSAYIKTNVTPQSFGSYDFTQ